MKLTKKGKEFLIQEEGMVLHPYKDQIGKPTIGAGNTFYEDGTPVKMTDKPITLDRATRLMDAVAVEFENAVIKATKPAVLNENQFAALVSIAWNIGVSGFSKSTLAKVVKANPNDPAITEHFKSWRNATVNGKKEPILLGRRGREAKLYFTPVQGSVLTKITTANVNLRLAAGTTHKILAELPKGTEVSILEEGAEWSQVFLCRERITGFVSSKYLI